MTEIQRTTKAGYKHKNHRSRKALADRFWAKVRVDPSGCWLWTAVTNKLGYGSIGRGGVNDGKVAAHRLAYALCIGAIPPGLFVCHSCDTPGCVYPGHLWLGTHDDNMRDAVSKGRMASGDRHGLRKHPKCHGSLMHPERCAHGDLNGSRTHPEKRPRGDGHWSRLRPANLRRGERNASSKLNPNKVAEIRSRFAVGDVTKTTLAEEYGVTRQAITAIIDRTCWKWVA
jgi:hypothetical protein